MNHTSLKQLQRCLVATAIVAMLTLLATATTSHSVEAAAFCGKATAYK